MLSTETFALTSDRLSADAEKEVKAWARHVASAKSNSMHSSSLQLWGHVCIAWVCKAHLRNIPTTASTPMMHLVSFYYCLFVCLKYFILTQTSALKKEKHNLPIFNSISQSIPPTHRHTHTHNVSAGCNQVTYLLFCFLFSLCFWQLETLLSLSPTRWFGKLCNVFLKAQFTPHIYLFATGELSWPSCWNMAVFPDVSILK